MSEKNLPMMQENCTEREFPCSTRERKKAEHVSRMGKTEIDSNALLKLFITHNFDDATSKKTHILMELQMKSFKCYRFDYDESISIIKPFLMELA